MGKFVEIHGLQFVGPNALNCDDLGVPKTVSFGRGDMRYRYSSQAVNRTIKDIICERYEGEGVVDYNSREHCNLLTEVLKNKYSFSDDDASVIASDVYKKVFEGETNAKRKKRKAPPKTNKKEKDSKKIEEKKHVTALISKYEIEYLADQIKKAYDSLSSEEKGDVELVVKNIEIDEKALKAGLKACLFGRMFASNPTLNVSATVQRSHMITTHKVDTSANIDNFTAMDELLEGGYVNGNPGAAHMDEKSFSCGCYYKSFIISVDELMDDDHLGSIKKIQPDFDVDAFLKDVIKTICISLPRGKSNSFLSQTSPSFILMNVVDNSLPLTYANAFSSPIGYDDKCVQNSINKLLKMYKNNIQWSGGYAFSGVWINSEYSVMDEEDSSIIKFEVIDELINEVVNKSK